MATVNDATNSFRLASRELFDAHFRVALEVVFKASDEKFGSDDDFEPRHRIEEELDAYLSAKGLGFVDGGSIGGGTMEVFCEVTKLGPGKNAILEFLKEPGYPKPIAIERE